VLYHSDFLPSEKEFFEFLKIRFATVGLNFDELEIHIWAALEVSEQRFILNKSKYYTSNDGSRAQFNASHYSSHALLLYQIARECFLNGRRDLADKIYFLNIATTATDLFYEVELPLRTGCDHPLGSVIGRASFSRASSLFFNNNCILGGNFASNGDIIYPQILGNLFLHPKSVLVGNVTVTGIVVLSNSAYVKDVGSLNDVLVFGSSPNLITKPISNDLRRNHSFLFS